MKLILLSEFLVQTKKRKELTKKRYIKMQENSGGCYDD